MHTAIRLSIATALAASWGAQAATTHLPATVASDLAAMVAQCTEVGGKALTEHAVKVADLNGDKRDDYILDVGSIQCDGAPSIYGDRAKSVTIYVGDGGDGARNAFRELAFEAKLEGTGSAAKLWLTVGGERCGKKLAADFASQSFCERSVVWNHDQRIFVFAPVATVRMQ